MGAIGTITLKDLKLRLRDRSVLITGILAPLVLAVVFNGVFGDALTGNPFDPTYGLVDLDGSEASASFADVLEGLQDDDVMTLGATYSSVAEAEAAVDDGAVDAVWVLPVGLGEAVMSGGDGSIEVIGSVDAPVSTQVAEAIATRFALGVRQVGLDVAAASVLSDGGVDADALIEDAVAAPPPLSLGTIDAATRRLDGPTSIMAGMAVFFLFFTVQFGVTSLLEEKREGTYARLQASPIPRWATVAAKGLGGFLLGMIAMTVLMVASSFLLGARWGPIVPVALLVVAGVASAVGIMGIVAAFAKTPESAGNIQSIIGVTLGLLGGSFFPIGQDGGLLSRLQFVTPHAWFLRGLGDLAGDGEIASVLPAVGALGLFGLVTGGTAWVFLRRAET